MAQGDTTLLAQMLEKFCDILYELELTTDEFMTTRFISSPAEDAQLDGLGDIASEPRLNRNDTEYLAAIVARLYMNQSGGEAERIISAVAQMTQSTNIHLTPIYPGKVYVTFVENPSFDLPSTLYDYLQRICAGGVKLILFQTSGTEPFTFDGSFGWDIGHLGTLYT